MGRKGGNKSNHNKNTAQNDSASETPTSSSSATVDTADATHASGENHSMQPPPVSPPPYPPAHYPPVGAVITSTTIHETGSITDITALDDGDKSVLTVVRHHSSRQGSPAVSPVQSPLLSSIASTTVSTTILTRSTDQIIEEVLALLDVAPPPDIENPPAAKALARRSSIAPQQDEAYTGNELVLLWTIAFLAAHQSSVWAFPYPDGKKPADISWEWFSNLSPWTKLLCEGNYSLSEASNMVLFATNAPKAIRFLKKMPENFRRSPARTSLTLFILVYAAMAAMGIGFTGFDPWAGLAVALGIGTLSFASSFVTRSPSVDKCLKNPANPLASFDKRQQSQTKITEMLLRMPKDSPTINSKVAHFNHYYVTAKQALRRRFSLEQKTDDEVDTLAKELAYEKTLHELGKLYPQGAIIATDQKELLLKDPAFKDKAIELGEAGGKTLFSISSNTAVFVFMQRAEDCAKIFIPSITSWTVPSRILFSVTAGIASYFLYLRSGLLLVQRERDIRLHNDRPYRDLAKVAGLAVLNYPTSTSMRNTFDGVINNPNGIVPWTPNSFLANTSLDFMQIIAWAVNTWGFVDLCTKVDIDPQGKGFCVDPQTPAQLAYGLDHYERVKLPPAALYGRGKDNDKGITQYPIFNGTNKIEENDVEIIKLTATGTTRSYGTM